MAWPNSQLRRVELSIQNAVIAGALTNYPVLITRANLPNEVCSPTDSNRAQADGGDIRFAGNNDGTSPYHAEIVAFEHDTSDGAGDAVVEIWVLIPSVSASVDTDFWMAYSTAGTTSQPAASDADHGSLGVWAEYLAVWHLSDLADSAGNISDLTASGSGAHRTSGGIVAGNADYNLDAAGAYLEVNEATGVGGNDFTLMQFFQRNSDDNPLGAYGVTVSNSGSAFQNVGLSMTRTGTDLQLGYEARNFSNFRVSGDPAAANDRALMAFLNDAVNNDVTYFEHRDTYGESSNVATSTELDGTGQNRTSIGRIGDSSPAGPAGTNANCWIDEARVYDGLLALDQLRALWNNVDSPATFVVEGTPESTGGGGGGLSIPVAMYNYRRRRAA